MSQMPPPLAPHFQPSRAASSNVGLALTIVMWCVWAGVMFVADLLGFLMFAFADSPSAGQAAQKMIAPAFLWLAFTLVAGAVLLYLRRWWSIAPAFVLAISPPFVIFAGYNLLDSAAPSGSSMTTPATAPMAQTPLGGFRPPPMQTREQPDFRKAFPATQTTKP
jgi:hypothetical protein